MFQRALFVHAEVASNLNMGLHNVLLEAKVTNTSLNVNEWFMVL